MKKLVLLLLPLLFIIACGEEEEQPIYNPPESRSCTALIFDQQRYEEAYSDDHTLVDVFIEGDSLVADIGYGGGCGEVKACLYASEQIATSYPPQAYVRINFTDNDDCEAWLTKRFAFDISSLKSTSTDTVVIHVRHINEPLRY